MTDDDTEIRASRASLLPWGLVALLVLVAIGLGTLVLVERHQAHDARATRDDRIAASQAAGSFSQALFTFDSSSPSSNLADVQAMVVPALRPKIAQLRSTAAPGTAPGAAVSFTASTDQVFVSEPEDGSLNALCSVDVTAVSAGKAVPLPLYLQLGMKREGGKWKVETVSYDVRPLAAASSGGGSGTSGPSGPSGPSTAPGSVPSSPTG